MTPAITQEALDVVFAYQAVLGRTPESVEGLVAKLGFKSEELLLTMLQSLEFKLRVVDVELRGQPSWLDSPLEDRALAAWLLEKFGANLMLPPNARWRDLYAELLADPDFLSVASPRLKGWEPLTLAQFASLLAAKKRSVSATLPPIHETADEHVVRCWDGFDKAWYRSNYGDTIQGDLCPITHYLRVGERQGLRPNPLFDPEWYRKWYWVEDGGSPLKHYLSWWKEYDINPGPLFDAAFYRATYQSQIGGLEPLAHYSTVGWRGGLSPSPAFDGAWYAAGRDLGALDPLSHYAAVGAEEGAEPHPLFNSSYVSSQLSRNRLTGAGALERYHRVPLIERRPNPLFDPEYYYSQDSRLLTSGLDALWHYYNEGASSGLSPSSVFDSPGYLERNHDVRDAGVNPLAHYQQYGAREGRSAHPLFDEDWYVRSSVSGVAREDALAHFMEEGWRRGLDPNPLFQTKWYLEQNPDVAATGKNPLAHYIDHGWREGRAPNPYFDVQWYRATYPEVSATGVEPLSHYLHHGAAQGYDPGPSFQTNFYKDFVPELRASGQNPLAYFLHTGILHGHPTNPSALFSDRTTLSPYDSWLEVNQFSSTEERALADQLSLIRERLPRISVVMPTFNTDLRLLARAIESVQAQIFCGWELCICDDASSNEEVWRSLQRYAARDPRIKIIQNADNQNISMASNAAAQLATGDVIALLDHDDELHPAALAEVAIAYGQNANLDIAYSDDDKIDAFGNRFAPQFKPGWSPTLLLSFMYVSHLFTFKRELFELVGGFRVGFEGCQDFDLLLRMSECAREVTHIPRVLYHWRAIEGSTALSGDSKPEAFERGVRAVQEALDRRGIPARAVWPEFARASRIGLFDLQFSDTGPSVTVVIPTKNQVSLLRNALESLRKTTYRNYEVLIVDNMSDDPETLAFLSECGARVLKVASPPEGFSFSHVVNAGVAECTSEYLLLLNNDTEVIAPSWLSQMVGYAGLPGVGAVGAKLLYADHRVQHGGITHGLHEGMAGHSFKLLSAHDHGYMSLAKATREVAAVTAACMLTPRTLFLELGGLDEADFRVAYNDVDYCYRLVDLGHRCIQCASAELFHFEGKSRGFGDNPAEERAMRQKYINRVDEWYNPNLTLAHEQFGVARTHVSRPLNRPVSALLVSHNLNHEGAPNSLFELAGGLAAQSRVRPVVVSPSDGPLNQRYTEVGIPTHVIPHPLLEWPAANEIDARLRQLGQTFLYAGVDVVICNTADSFWAVAAARRANLPSIWIIRESESWSTYYAHLPRHLQELAYKCFEHPYRIVFVARSTMESWSALDDRGAFTLIRNGLNVERLSAAFASKTPEAARTRAGVDLRSVVFTIVGTVSERKGQLDIVMAFASLPHELAASAEVVIVGDRPSPYSDKLHSYVQAMPEPLKQRISIVPESADVADYLLASDVFVCSSRVESYPRVTLEAMAASLPVISTPVWGLREQLRPGYNALFYEPGDVAALAQLMVKMISSPDLRRAFGARSPVVLGSLPGYDFMIEQYTQLIEQAAGTRQ